MALSCSSLPGCLAQVWQQDFEDRLRIRFFTHHSKCSQCIKHRLIIKKLGFCPPARRVQFALLRKHLDRQHKDRQQYWACRAESRVDSTSPTVSHICGIIDSMDAAKHAWPRTKNMSAKEFSSFNRPRLTSTTLILHGHSVTLALSPSYASSNSSRTVEIVSVALTKLQRKIDLRGVTLSLQGDNCSKELKNNGTLRALAFWISTHRLKAGRLCFLTSGHSHEDVDALFGCLRSWINCHGELHVPESFQSCLQSYFDDPTRRPYEKEKTVIMMKNYCDWILFQTYSWPILSVLVFLFFKFPNANGLPIKIL